MYRCFYRSRRKPKGLTLVEMMVGMAISSMVIIALMALTIMVGKIHKSVHAQQRALASAKSAMEGLGGLNREIRMAEQGTLGLNGWGNRIVYQIKGEVGQREIELTAGADGDIMTPWDNELVARDSGGNETVIADWLAPKDVQGAFHCLGAYTPLTVNMRAGDPVGDPSVAQTGPGVQGAEIHIMISPRNSGG